MVHRHYRPTPGGFGNEIDDMIQEKLIARGYSKKAASIIGLAGGLGTLAAIVGVSIVPAYLLHWDTERQNEMRNERLEQRIESRRVIEESKVKRLDKLYEEHPEYEKVYYIPIGAHH